MAEPDSLSSRMVADSLDDLMREGIAAILKGGVRALPSRGYTTGLQATTLELTDPRARWSRSEGRGKIVSCVAELAWYLSGSADRAAMSHYLPTYGDADTPEVPGAYGPRLFGDGNRFRTAVDRLERSPDTRKSVAVLLEHDDLVSGKSEVPCTCTLQLLVRSGRLHLIASMRSSDAYRGFLHDVFCFTMLQELAARQLGIEAGSYVHIAGSYHLYDTDRPAAQAFLAEGFQTRTPMPSMPSGSQWGHAAQFAHYVAEQRLAGEAIDTPPGLPPYWRDLCLVMHAAALLSAGRADEFVAVKRVMSSSAFAVFLDDRVRSRVVRG